MIPSLIFFLKFSLHHTKLKGWVKGNFFHTEINHTMIIKRPGEAGAVLQTPPSLIDWLNHSVSNPFPPNLQNTINPKPLERHLSHVICFLCCFCFVDKLVELVDEGSFTHGASPFSLVRNPVHSALQPCSSIKTCILLGLAIFSFSELLGFYF